MVDPEMEEGPGRKDSGPKDGRAPASWVKTEILECELWNAIAEDFAPPLDEGVEYDDEDEFLDPEEEFADEDEMRNSVFRQLADLRPNLADLLSATNRGD